MGLFKNPPPTLFLVALLTYGMATLSYYKFHKSDKYQDMFVVGGGIVGTAVGCLRGADAQCILLTFVPWCILLSLILSSAAHRVVGRRWVRKTREENGYLHDKSNYVVDEEKGTAMF